MIFVGGCMNIERSENFARYIIDNACTIRECAKAFDYSKSTIHNDISNKLKFYNIQLYQELKVVLDNNFKNKHIRGGQATKAKYEKK